MSYFVNISNIISLKSAKVVSAFKMLQKTVGDLPQRFRCNETPGHLHPEVYNSNVHNSQTVQGASVSIER